MNYELAKELKDAGFPQMEHGDYSVFMDWNLYSTIPYLQIAIYKDKGLEMGLDRVYLPTLSELIEACGKDVLLCELNGKWNAVRHAGVSQAIDFLGLKVFLTMLGGNGDTPEEAVARLWLAINKK